MTYLLYCFLAIVSFFLWASLHELSHFAMVKLFRHDANGKFKLYPHMEDGTFCWAAVHWSFPDDGKFLDPKQLGWVYFAPRIVDILGCIFTVALSLMVTGPFQWVALILAGGSVVDLIVGSIGHDKLSDLQRFCHFWEWDPMTVRILGFGGAVLTVLFASMSL